MTCHRWIRSQRTIGMETACWCALHSEPYKHARCLHVPHLDLDLSCMSPTCPSQVPLPANLRARPCVPSHTDTSPSLSSRELRLRLNVQSKGEFLKMIKQISGDEHAWRESSTLRPACVDAFEILAGACNLPRSLHNLPQSPNMLSFLTPSPRLLSDVFAHALG